MGSLSNLYISQSYQSLIHIGTNNTASATLIGLQDGLGNNIGVSVNTNGDLFLSGSLTASLQQGYLYVGNASGKTTAFATSSLVTTVNTGSLVTTASFNAFTQSINSATASLFSSASLGLTTASFSGNTLTFTKGNGTTFGIVIPDVSGSTIDTGSFATTSSFNSYTQSTNIRLNNLESTSASVNVSISNLNSTTSSFATSIANLNSNSASVNTSITNLNASSASQQVSIDALNTFTASQSTASIVTSINNLNQATSSLFGSASLALVTASFDNSTRNLTFTKGDTSTFNVNIPDVSGSAGDFVTTSSFNSYTQSNDQRVSSLESNSASVNISIANINTTTASLLVETQNLELFSASALISISNLNQSSASQQVSIDNLNQKTGSYATTGSNTFRGNETFEDAGGNASTLVPTSGSLMLVAKSFTSASAHLSSSFTNSVNLIFKNSDTTADTIISGSNNIFTNPAAITAGFKRYIGGSSNIAMNASAVPQISGSMGFSPAMSNNYFGAAGGMIMRGPVSSSTYNISNNLINNTSAYAIGSAAATNAEKMVSGCTITNNLGSVFIRVQAYKTPLSSSFTYSTSTGAGVVDLNLHSSSINYGGNVSYGGTTINNLYFPTTVDSTSSLVTVNSCQFMGSNNIVFSGSNASMTGETRRLGNSIMIGFNSASLVLNGDSGSLFATSILGAGLSVTGSNSRFTTLNIPNNDFGSAFVGRYNDQLGNKARTAETVFAVGTGTANATANRKTGFLIDSGSNTFIEGTLNVSGATSLNGTTNITGSLLLNGNTITAVNTASLATTGSNSFNGTQRITGSLIVSGSGAEVRFPSFDVTAGRIKETLSFTGSRFASGILSMSLEMENLNTYQFGFNQLATGDSLTGTQFTAETNKDSTFTELKLNARYTGSNNAEILIRNTAGVRTATVNADNSTFNGNVKVASTFQLQLPVGSNQQAGTAVLDGANPGTVTVSNSLVTANSIIMVSKQTLAHTNGYVAVSSKGAGTFTITSNHNGDTDTVGWFIINNS